MEDSRCSMQPVFRNAKTGNGQKWSGAASGGSAGFYNGQIRRHSVPDSRLLFDCDGRDQFYSLPRTVCTDISQ